MFSLLLERCNLLEARGDPRVVLQPNNQLQEDLCNLLAPVEVWCDWLLGNNNTWYSLVSAALLSWPFRNQAAGGQHPGEWHPGGVPQLKGILPKVVPFFNNTHVNCYFL